jgi:hypothetical protein
MNVSIDYLIRRCEKNVERSLKSSRIFPEILDHASPHVSRLT